MSTLRFTGLSGKLKVLQDFPILTPSQSATVLAYKGKQRGLYMLGRKCCVWLTYAQNFLEKSDKLKGIEEISMGASGPIFLKDNPSAWLQKQSPNDQTHSHRPTMHGECSRADLAISRNW